MNVLAIMGSPRKEGNSASMMEAALGALPPEAVIHRIFLADLRIAPCGMCRACKTKGQCALDDDMRLLTEEIRWSEIILIASPTHFSSVGTLVQTFMERTWCHKGLLKNKVGGTLVTGRRYMESSINTLRAFMLRHGMILGSAGALGYAFSEMGSLDQDPLALKDARATGLRVVELFELMR